MYKEIYKTASWKTLVEFCIFKARITAATHLETGLLSGTSKSHNIVYYDGTSRYSIRFPKKRGPCPFSQVTTTNETVEEDVTERIREFAGPSHNFHGIPTTPEMLEYTNLTFTYKNGFVTKFESQDYISSTPSRPKDI